MQQDFRLFYIDSIYRKQIHCFSDSEKVENICGKGKFTSIFSIFLKCCQKPTLQRSFKNRIVY